MNGIAMVLQVAVSFVLADVAVSVAFALAEAGDIRLAPFVLVVMGAITLFLAMPAYVALRQIRRETWLSCIVAGSLVGVVVAAVALLPAQGTVQIGQEMTVVEGVRTAAGWQIYAEAVGIAGSIGASAGAVFWAALRVLERGERWPRLGRLPLSAGISLAVAATWMVLAIPGLTMDRSCHNVLRDGRRSIGPVLFFTVDLAGGEWSGLQDTAERFAAAEGWGVTESNDKDRTFSARRFVSACIEPGTEISFGGADLSSPTRADVSVFQPQGGNSWQGPARRLLAAIEARFPGQLRRDWTGTEAQTPSTLLPEP